VGPKNKKSMRNKAPIKTAFPATSALKGNTIPK